MGTEQPAGALALPSPHTAFIPRNEDPPMRIDRIELYRVAMPLISPWRTAYGEDAVIESVLVQMTSGDRAGWGESSPLAAPTYSPEWAGGVFHVARTWLAPRLVGRDVPSGAELQR